jgi:hypothetical protein
MLLQLGGESSQNNFKCTWKGNESKLLAPIALNKNGCKSNKTLKVIISVISVWQLPQVSHWRNGLCKNEAYASTRNGERNMPTN